MKHNAAVALAVVLLIGTCWVLPPVERRPVGGPWSTHYESSWSMDAFGSTTLYRRALFGFPVRVARDVHVMQYYAPDCLLYENGHMTTVLADCAGARFVVAEHGYDVARRFVATAAGLHRTIDARVENGIATWTVERIPIERIRGAARRQGSSRLRVEAIVTHEPIDVRARDQHGATPLLRAIRNGQREVAVALLRAGADVDAADSAGMTPLQVAAGGPRPDTTLVRVILDARPDLERPDIRRMTPLLRAALHNDTTVFRMLLERGADPCRRDEKGRTIVDLATREAPAVRAAMVGAYARCAGR